MYFFKKNRLFVLWFISIMIASTFFLSQKTFAAETPRDWEWVQKIGGTWWNNEEGYGISVDSEGNSYIVWDFNWTAVFWNTNLTSIWSSDIFIAKISNTWEFLWAKRAGGTGSDYWQSISIDDQWNSYIIWNFYYNADFGNNNLTSIWGAEVFVAKINNDWEFIWAKRAGGTSSDYWEAISVDDQWNSYIAWKFNATADFGNNNLTSTSDRAYRGNVFISKLSNTWEFLWAKRAGGTGNDGWKAINIDNQWNIYVGGTFYYTADFGNINLTSIWSSDDFITKLSNDWEFLWAKRAGNDSSDYFKAINVDNQWNSYIAWLFRGTADFGNTILTSTWSDDAFISKLSSTGQFLWAKRVGGVFGDHWKAISIDNQWNVYLGWTFRDTADFGWYTLTASWSYDAFVAKISNTWEFLWVQKGGGSSSEEVYGITIDEQWNNYIIWVFYGDTIFGGSSIIGEWSNSIFITKLWPPRVVLPQSASNTDIINTFINKWYTQSGSELLWYKSFSLINTNGLISTTLSLNNNNNKLNLPNNIQFKQENGTTDYTNKIMPPTDYSVSTVDGKDVISAISVGSETESIKLVNDVATLSIPALGKTIGDPVSVYSSQDGSDWTLEKGGIVQEVDGQPYAVFTTNHFTYFAIADSTGSFVINDDAGYSSELVVNLSISAPTAQYMRFSNEGTWNRSSWETYATWRVWNLFPENWLRTVYAEFDIDGDYSADVITLDTIELNGPEFGNLTLEILTWTSECVYGTSLNLSWQDVKLNEWYTFTGSFSGQWYCADYVGVSDGWVLDISVSDLTNEWGNIISWSLITIGHDGAITQGDSTCTWYDGTPSTFNTEPYELIEKTSWSDKICKVTLDNVNLKVNVPAFQAPGNYNGTLTLTVPNF